jgi:trehalose-phosphatase
MKTRKQKAPLSRPPRPLFLLDYDGTLADFDRNPEKARLSPSGLRLLRRLRRRHPVVLVSGRHLEGLLRVSRLKGFPMVGSHGFEARGLPDGLQMAPVPLRQKYRREAARLDRALRPLLVRYPGVHLERKPFSATLHYRGVGLAPGRIRGLHRDFRGIFRKTVTPGMWSLLGGKKMLEAKPRGFSKGKAVRKLLGKFPGHQPVYAGDDLTDLTVFKALGRGALRVAVGDRIPRGFYDLRFESPSRFLGWLRAFAASPSRPRRR